MSKYVHEYVFATVGQNLYLCKIHVAAAAKASSAVIASYF